jgi:hypothetical protein
MLRSGLVRTPLGVKAAIGQNKTLDRPPMKQMLVDDLLYIFDVDKAVPDRVRIHHHDRAMFALVEASQLVRANLPLQASVFDGVLEGSLEFSASFAPAAWPGGVLVALIGADKEMVLKLGHDERFPPREAAVRCTGVSETIQT